MSQADVQLVMVCAKLLDDGLAPLIAASVITPLQGADIERRIVEALPMAELPRTRRALSIVAAPAPKGGA